MHEVMFQAGVKGLNERAHDLIYSMIKIHRSYIFEHKIYPTEKFTKSCVMPEYSWPNY